MKITKKKSGWKRHELMRDCIGSTCPCHLWHQSYGVLCHQPHNISAIINLTQINRLLKKYGKNNVSKHRVHSLPQIINLNPFFYSNRNFETVKLKKKSKRVCLFYRWVETQTLKTLTNTKKKQYKICFRFDIKLWHIILLTRNFVLSCRSHTLMLCFMGRLRKVCAEG